MMSNVLSAVQDITSAIVKLAVNESKLLELCLLKK